MGGNVKNVDLNKIEILAPAGNYESFMAAVNAGANAVYMGLKSFNARVMTNNFSVEEYMLAIDYAHKRDVKVYLTLNTLLLDSEIKEALELVYELYKVGLDGVIVQDIGIADAIHKIMPDLSLHASTQMSVCTLEQVKTLEMLGFERVVLARELDINEIKYIAQNTKLEIEVFVHGALCVSVSGQCLMSAMIGGRSANRGSCAGPCRKKYSLYNSSGKLIEKNKYLISKKDIFGLDKLNELIDAGICSLKIEGRNKTPEYVAGVVKNYREALDNGYKEYQDKEVLQLFNRSGKSQGYLEGVRYKNSISYTSPKNTGILLGKVLDVKKNYIKVKLSEDIDMHDGIEILGDNTASAVVTCIRDEKFGLLNRLARKNSIVWLGDIEHVKVGEYVYKTSSSSLNNKYREYSKLNLKRLEYDVVINIVENENISARVDKLGVEVKIEYMPEISKTTSVNECRVKQAFAKTEETSVKLNISCKIQDGLFVSTSKLNELRKKIVEELEKTKVIRRSISDIDERINRVLAVSVKELDSQRQNSLYVYRYNKEVDYIKYYKEKYNKKLEAIYITPSDFKLHEKDIFRYMGMCKIYFVIPNVTLKNMTRYIQNTIEELCKKGISGIVIGNIGFIPLCSELKAKYNLQLVGDYSLNTMNKYTARKLKEMGIDKITPLFENDNIDLEGINSVLPVELVQDMATVMTTRYCVIASFAKNVDEDKKQKCEVECAKYDYYLVDEQNKRYDILTDSFDCISRYIRNKKQYTAEQENKYSIRHCVLK